VTVLPDGIELASCDAVRDGDLIRDLTRANFYAAMAATWNEERHQREPMHPERYTMVRRAGETIGFFALRPDAGAMYLQTIQLVPAARGTGLGTHLLHHIHALAAASGATAMRLRVFRSNDGARRLYERLGYVTAVEDANAFVLERALP
jgi:ribosomal protein S18 acetylase RimI-like enzyme